MSTTAPAFAFDFFISRRGTVAAEAQEVADILQSEGYRVLVQDYDAALGESFPLFIHDALTNARHLLVLYSADYDSAHWTRQEFANFLAAPDAHAAARRIGVLRCDAADPRGLLSGVVYGDLHGVTDPAERRRIVLAVARGEALAARPSPRTRVLFDQSYQQGQWYGQPTIDAGYSEIARVTEPLGTVIVNNSGYKDLRTLQRHDVLILPVPFRTFVEDVDYEMISNWVYQGGGLLVLGFYLAELHHRNNINVLLRRFGMEFSYDLLMPIGKEKFQHGMAQAFAHAEKELWVTTKPEGKPLGHSLLRDISRISFTSACSIESVGRPEFIAYTGQPVAVMHAIGYREPQTGRMIRIEDYISYKRDRMPFLVAVRHGAGRVIAIGTWKIFLNTYMKDRAVSNGNLYMNSIRWLKGE